MDGVRHRDHSSEKVMLRKGELVSRGKMYDVKDGTTGLGKTGLIDPNLSNLIDYPIPIHFLVAKSNSMRGFVRPSVHPSVRWSVGPSVGHAFLGNREFK